MPDLNPKERKPRLYKVLKVRRRSASNFGEYYFTPYQQFDFGEYLPIGDKPGKWTPKLRSMPVVCVRGWHLTRAPRRLIRQNKADQPLGPDLAYVVYIAEGRGLAAAERFTHRGHKIAFQSIRLIKRANPYWETPLPPRKSHR